MKQFWKFDVGIVRAKRNAKKKVGKKLIKKKKKKKKKKKAKLPLFFRGFGVLFFAAGACNSAGHHSGLPDWTLGVLKWPKIAKKGYIVIITDCGHRKRKSADF